MLYNYSNLSFSQLVEKIGKSRYWNLPKMLEEILKRVATTTQTLPQIISTSEGTFEIIPLSNLIMLTLYGTETEVKIPPISGNEGKILFISNIGSSDSTLVSNTGGSDLIEGGIETDNVAIPLGSVLRVINNLKNETEYTWTVL